LRRSPGAGAGLATQPFELDREYAVVDEAVEVEGGGRPGDPELLCGLVAANCGRRRGDEIEERSPQRVRDVGHRGQSSILILVHSLIVSLKQVFLTKEYS